MSSDEPDTVQKLHELFEELSEEEAREFFENIQLDPGREDVWWPWPPGEDWPTPPWWPRPRPPREDWPTPPWWPRPPEEEIPIDLHSTRRPSSQSARQPTTSVRVSTPPDLRLEDSEEIPFEVDVTVDAANTEDPELLVVGDVVRWVQVGSEILGRLLGQVPEGEGGGTVVLQPSGDVIIIHGDVKIINGSFSHRHEK